MQTLVNFLKIAESLRKNWQLEIVQLLRRRRYFSIPDMHIYLNYCWVDLFLKLCLLTLNNKHYDTM